MWLAYLSFFPSMGCLNHYFLKKRAMVIGIMVGGSSLGGLVRLSSCQSDDTDMAHHNNANYGPTVSRFRMVFQNCRPHQSTNSSLVQSHIKESATSTKSRSNDRFQILQRSRI